MKLVSKYKLVLGFVGTLCIFATNPVFAGGEVGDHVNHLSENIDKYSKEVSWLVEKMDEIVGRYETGGAKAANSSSVVDHWEAVDFHAAIESNYVPLYASIWQGLYGVKGAIDGDASVDVVREEKHKLEHALWQSLGAVKLAAQFQDRGLLEKVALREGGPSNSIEALSEIKMRLDRVLAKFAEKLNDPALEIVYDTYLNLFEGVEGELIAQDANLVEDLEKDFNVTLPKAIEANQSVNEVRDIIIAMQTKLDKSKAILETNKKTKKDVF